MDIFGHIAPEFDQISDAISIKILENLASNQANFVSLPCFVARKTLKVKKNDFHKLTFSPDLITAKNTKSYN